MFMKRYLSQSPSQAYFRSQATSLSDVSQTASYKWLSYSPNLFEPTVRTLGMFLTYLLPGTS